MVKRKEKDPGDRALTLYLLPQPPELLEPIHRLGRVRTKLYVTSSPLWISSPFSAYSAISHLCSPGLGNLQSYHQSLIGSKRVRGSGTQHINIPSMQYDVTNIMQITGEQPLPPSAQERMYGSPPGTSD